MDQDNQINLDDLSTYQQPLKNKQNNMALASLIMGIIGIVTSCCCFGGLIFGSLGIVFALLSKTRDRFEGNAVAGLITSIIGLVFTAIVFILFVGSGLMEELAAGGGF
jgi:EamA domain-containing membrane protein RarD